MSKPASWVTEYHRVPNRIKVLQLIRAEGSLSRADIARRLELSRPTASRIIEALMREGIITCVGKSQPTGGRLGDLYTFRVDAGVVLGLQLGTRDARAAISTLGGEMLFHTARRLALDKRQNVLPQIRKLVADALAGVPQRPVTVVSVGVAVPGVVNMSTGKVSFVADAFPGLSDRLLLQELEQLFGVPVVMDNDVNLATLGEHISGCAQGYDNIAYLFIGSGIGAGFMLHGQLLRSSAGAAGEVGYMLIDRPHLYRHFRPHGCLESVAGIGSLVEAARATGLPHDSAEAVCELAQAGNVQALAVVRVLNEYLAAAVINTVAILDPEIVVLGGDLADLPHAESLFLQPIADLIDRHVIHTPVLRLSELQGEAALHGALHQALGAALAVAGRTGAADAALPPAWLDGEISAH